jgi:7-cyano-7-deazaguanine synthase in queuosine biosynthesis
MTEIRLREPVVRGNAVDFAWSVEPDQGFYIDPRFTLEFPESVDVASVPEGVWLRVMMICLYSHWAVLRPCRVVLPRTLPEGEREFWSRMVDSGVWTLEVDQDTSDGPTYSERTARAVEIVETGLPAGELPASPPGEGSTTAFSGGRDSLTQTGLLHELGLAPLLVTTTSKRQGSIEFETQRFRSTLDETQSRTGLELIEVTSNIRNCFVNNHPLVARYELAASELTDTQLYFANAWAVAWSRGANAVFLASEAEAQESIRRDGMVVQMEHFGFSAATQRALSTLIAPTGITYAGLTASLEHFQIQRVLEQRYPELAELQYSCYSQRAGEEVCSNCFNCLKTSLHKMSNGSAPSDIGIDLNKVLEARSDWTPEDDGENRSSVASLYGERLNNHLVRLLRDLDDETVATFAPDGVLTAPARAGLARLRATAFDAPDPPGEPGYRAEYLELLDEPLRSGLDEIFSELFAPEPPAAYAEMLANTRLLSDWIAAPLVASRLKTEVGVEAV